MTSETLEIIKQKDDWKFSIEIHENSKGEPSVTIKTRSDESPEEAGKLALTEYNRLKAELLKEIKNV